MRALHSLILASAAGLAWAGAAQAADLPVKAKAVEYVKVCSLYGAGFFYIPGTDTCIKLSGYMRADVTINGGAAHGQPAWNGDTGQGNRYANKFIDRSRWMLAVDTRTGTEYGAVRTFGSAKFQFTSFGAGSVNPNTVNTAVPNVNSAASYGLGSLVNNSNLLDTPGGGYVAVIDLFVQFAGFTFGKSASAFASPWQGSPAGQLSSFLLGGHSGDGTGTNNIQYTAQFGNGVSATIGLDDPTVWDRTVVYNLGSALALTANLSGNNAYAGVHAPDVVGNIRIDQAWGLFQISGAAHEVNASYNSLGLNALADGSWRGARADRPFRTVGPPRYEVGRSRDGGAADQEPADRRR